MVILVTSPDGSTRHASFPRAPRVTIGRGRSCDVRLPSAFVSDVHLIVEDRDGRRMLSAPGENGAFVNGTPAAREATRIADTDSVFVQGFQLRIGPDGVVAAPDDGQGRAAFNDALRRLHDNVIRRLDPRLLAVDDVRSPAGRRAVLEVLGAEVAAAPLTAEARHYAAREALRDSVLRIALGRATDEDAGAAFGSPTQELVRKRYGDTIARALGVAPGAAARGILARIREQFAAEYDRVAGSLPDDVRDYLARWLLHKELADLMFELGPLSDLLRVPEITEIMVVSKDLIFVEAGGLIEETGKTFVDDSVSERIIERILAPINRRADRSSPMVDARLPDGSRVNAVIPPVAQHGPCITIRRFGGAPLTSDALIQIGTLTPRCAALLKACVHGRKNIVVAGGTGSGKTTLLNALSSWIPERERVITIEDTAELRLQQRHVVSLEGRPMNAEQRGEITIRDLVRNALRMRPDRIVVGECRGAEALDMLQAMNTGHDGSLTTIHANTPQDVVRRLEVMVLQAADMPMAAIRQQIAAAVHLIVQISRLPTGARVISHVTELRPDDNGGEPRLADIMRRRSNGRLTFTGRLPSFVATLAASGGLDVEELLS
jgi:pilus assembly protein CpaF